MSLPPNDILTLIFRLCSLYIFSVSIIRKDAKVNDPVFLAAWKLGWVLWLFKINLKGTSDTMWRQHCCAQKPIMSSGLLLIILLILVEKRNDRDRLKIIAEKPPKINYALHAEQGSQCNKHFRSFTQTSSLGSTLYFLYKAIITYHSIHLLVAKNIY